MSELGKSKPAPRPRLRSVDRDQFVLRAMDIEQFIPDDHAARALWEFTGRLDLAKFHEPMKAVEGHPGQPGNKRYGVAQEFASDKFTFVAELNSVRCPAEQLLPYYRIADAPSGVVREYKAKADVCAACPFKPQCCPHTATRTIRVLEDDPEITAFRAKMETPESAEIYKQRSQVAEFANAWLKDKIGLRRFRVRGLRKVRLESVWAALTYNIQQWIRLRWRK